MKLITLLLFLPLTLLAKEDRLILVGASYGKNVLAICEADGTVIWKHKTGGPERGHTGHHDLQLLANGNILFHDSWSVTSEITLGKKITWKHDSKGANVHAFQRLANGNTMIAESGIGRIVHLDKEGQIQKEVPLPKDGRHQTRMLEILPNGHYLSCAENPGVVTEYDPTGKIVWEYPTKTRVFGAIRLKNGNTLIATGSGNSILEVSPDKKVVWEMAKKIPGTDIELAWTTDLQELPNGNLVIGNCHAGDKNPQIVELDKDRKVVWTFDEYELVGNGLACWEILDAKQTALVRSLLKKTSVEK
ncbi:MAG: PQQ-binding-like beta-propeller repeat protein [Akkermansiaceae bacterium]|nr:PQQ-binding-like beta-propeller repeat protein [Akkermansiaceae bacterium]